MIVPEKYIDEIINKFKGKKITPEMVKKDLALSYLLYDFGKHKEDNIDSPFHKIIFKGGTLLAKSYLDYHRISEDLDFTFKDNKTLNSLSAGQREKSIKKFLKEEFLPILSGICEKYGFDFNSNEINNSENNSEKSYCPIKYSHHFTRFNIYINKSEENPIKIEISFCDELFYTPEQVKINHLHPTSSHLTYPLEDIQIECYTIEEVLVEKIRAIITREDIHERDIYDLFLLSNIGHNIFDLSHEDIKKKIIQGIGYNRDKVEERKIILGIGERLEVIEENLEGDISDINLTNYDPKSYQEFFKKIKKMIISIDFKGI